MANVAKYFAKIPRSSMDKGAKGWLIKTAVQYLPSVAPSIDLDDLIQEGLVCYYYSRWKYPKAIDPPHIMRLFQLTFLCRLSDIAEKSKRQVDFATGDIFEDLDRHPTEQEQASFAAALATTPEDIKSVLSLFTREESLLALRRPYSINARHRETLNERLCALIGIDPAEVALTSAFVEYFRL